VNRPPELFDLQRLTREPLANRGGKANVADFAKPPAGGASFAEWLDSLPNIQAGREFRELVEAIVAARAGHRAVHAALGAHVAKVGLGPPLAEWAARGILTAVAVNGAFIIHEYEIAAAGFTSENVDAALPAGAFGMTEDTGQAIAAMVELAERRGVGLGLAAAEFLAEGGFPHADATLLAACHRADVPVTAHAALGADVAHLHPALDPAKFGAALMRDFRAFITLVGRLEDGVYLNIGSAVVLPEVFLKALTAVRNAGIPVQRLTCANFDFLRPYRALTNVVNRPTVGGGRGVNLTGSHEILIPLLTAAVLHRLWSPTEDQQP
jgi:hypothetical protein